MLDGLLAWDRETLIYLNSLGSEKYDSLWLIITEFTTWIPLFLTIIFLLFFKNSRKHGAWMLLSFMAMLIVLTISIQLAKHGFGRLRPNNDETIDLLIRVVRRPSDFSFFSGHASSSFSIATLAVLFLRKRFPWIHFVWIYPVLFSFSRIYLGVHFPLDILVGAMVGVLFALIFYRMHQKFRAPYIM